MSPVCILNNQISLWYSVCLHGSGAVQKEFTLPLRETLNTFPPIDTENVSLSNGRDVVPDYIFLSGDIDVRLQPPVIRPAVVDR